MQCSSCGARIVEGRCIPSWQKEGNANAGRLITHIVQASRLESPRESNETNQTKIQRRIKSLEVAGKEGKKLHEI